MPDRQVAITGRGVVSCAGLSVDAFNRSLLAGEGHIGIFTETASGPPGVDDQGALRLRFTRGAPVTGFDTSAHFDSRAAGGLDVFSQFAAVAGRQAWAEAGFSLDAPAGERVGVVIGTANGGHASIGDGWRRILSDARKPAPLTIPMTMASGATSRVAREIGARGPSFATSSACASAAHAILTGLMFVRSGLADVMVVGGSDHCFDYGYLRAWDSLRVVSPDICRPFSKGRQGLSLGEGAALFVIESVEHARARGARILALLAGGAMNSDAGDLTSPDKAGMARAMAGAIADSGFAIDRFGYINAHGTGTQINDRLEAQAIRDVFGAAADHLPVSSIKSSIGHAMGASGALELLASIATLEKGIAPPTLNFQTPDPECPIDVVPEGPRKIEVEALLSNSFAFGGLNVTLAVARADAQR